MNIPEYIWNEGKKLVAHYVRESRAERPITTESKVIRVSHAQPKAKTRKKK